MGPRDFAPRDVRLRDGRLVLVRAVLPNDEDEILQAFDRMSPDARYMRFMTARRHVNVERLRAVLASFPHDGMAIAATLPATDGIDIVGTASFVVLEEPTHCEFAISIVDAWAGAGLGRIMLRLLVDNAAGRGLSRMQGYILSGNWPMLRLAERTGFVVRSDPQDPTVRIATLAL